MAEKKCSCGCGCDASEKAEYHIPVGDEMTLAELPVGTTATIVKVMPKMRGRAFFMHRLKGHYNFTSGPLKILSKYSAVYI